MRLGILQCDDVASDLIDRFGNYDDMFKNIFSKVCSNIFYSVFHVNHNEFPDNANSCDAWLISGSKQGVYDNIPWIIRLQEFVRELYKAHRKVLGVCFGHQMMAQALGGLVRLSPEDWVMGIVDTENFERCSWMVPFQKKMSFIACHQDQVFQLPNDSKVLSSSQVCTYHTVQYGGCFIGVQSHPEFSREYLSEILLAEKLGFSTEIAQKTLSSINNRQVEVEGELMIRWMVNFLNEA